jgi:hypothetical protein
VLGNLRQLCWSRELHATAAAWGVGAVLGGGEDVGRCLTYIGESLQFVLSFRVGPRTNRLVGDKGLGKKRGKRAAVRKQT